MQQPSLVVSMWRCLAVTAAVFGVTGAAQAAEWSPGDRVVLATHAGPGSGIDMFLRQVQNAWEKNKIVQARVTVENKGGAGGTIGIAQFVNSQKGDGNALMVGGMVMVGAIITNKSPVTLAQVTPIARLTGEYEVVVVPASSKIKTMKELADQLKANPGSVAFGGGSAGGTDHILAAMAPLGDDYTSVLHRAFGERWIDFYPTEGKRSGAYSNGGAYDVHPFLLINYTNNYESVSTIAHEWGHAMHTYLSARNQPFATSEYATFVAEIASTLNDAPAISLTVSFTMWSR